MSIIAQIRDRRKLRAEDVASLTARAEYIEAQAESLEKFIATLDTPSWNAVVRFLAAKLREKEHARSDIPPADTIRQAMVQGQINQIGELANVLENAKADREQLLDQLNDIMTRLGHKEK